MKEKMRFKIRRADKGDIPQIVENWNQLMHSHVRLRAKFYKIKADAEKLYLRFLKKTDEIQKSDGFRRGVSWPNNRARYGWNSVCSAGIRNRQTMRGL